MQKMTLSQACELAMLLTKRGWLVTSIDHEPSDAVMPEYSVTAKWDTTSVYFPEMVSTERLNTREDQIERGQWPPIHIYGLTS